ncbi:hypothetical protein BALOs_0749 [Halobacteriovorax sp. BALOs_7]|nr:hypothetical protein BALOs_0749 [Halobacteriovorax sp. BALOs_7]
MGDSSYKNKPVLKKSLIDPAKELSEKDIQRLLSSRVKINKKVNIAVTRLNSNNDFQRIDEEVAQRLYKRRNWGAKAQSIIPMPQLLIESPISLSNLRRSAVLLQADLLVVIAPRSVVDWDFNFFEDNTAKATTSLEVILLDIRTGVVPFTSIITETVELKKINNDYSNEEMLERARIESEKKALFQVSGQVAGFLKM